MEVSLTAVKLLDAAAQVAGGTRALARRLDISEVLLEAILVGRRGLPDALLLRAVDIILEDRDARAERLGGPSEQLFPEVRT